MEYIDFTFFESVFFPIGSSLVDHMEPMRDVWDRVRLLLHAMPYDAMVLA